jgi:hypothetical protein
MKIRALQGVLQSSGSAVVVLLVSSKSLEFFDPPIWETGPFDFGILGPIEQIVALCFGKKLDHPIWQTGTLNFPQFHQKPNACCAKSFAIVFSSIGPSKRAIISRHLSRYAFKDMSKHCKVPTICCTTNNESPNASSYFAPLELRIWCPNKMVLY